MRTLFLSITAVHFIFRSLLIILSYLYVIHYVHIITFKTIIKKSLISNSWFNFLVTWVFLTVQLFKSVPRHDPYIQCMYFSFFFFLTHNSTPISAFKHWWHHHHMKNVKIRHLRKGEKGKLRYLKPNIF